MMQPTEQKSRRFVFLFFFLASFFLFFFLVGFFLGLSLAFFLASRGQGPLFADFF